MKNEIQVDCKNRPSLRPAGRWPYLLRKLLIVSFSWDKLQSTYEIQQINKYKNKKIVAEGKQQLKHLKQLKCY